MDWFQCFSSDLCLDQVEKTVCVTCGSLSSYMFHPASFKSTWLPMFLHILGLWTFLPPLCISRRRPGIVRISFLKIFSGVPEACKDLFVKKWWPSGELCRSSLSSVSPLSTPRPPRQSMWTKVRPSPTLLPFSCVSAASRLDPTNLPSSDRVGRNRNKRNAGSDQTGS